MSRLPQNFIRQEPLTSITTLLLVQYGMLKWETPAISRIKLNHQNPSAYTQSHRYGVRCDYDKLNKTCQEPNHIEKSCGLWLI